MAMDYQTAVSLVSVGVGVCIDAAIGLRDTACRRYLPRFPRAEDPGTSLSVNYRIDNRSPQLLGFLSLARECVRILKPTALRLATDRSVSPVAELAPKRFGGSLS